MVSLSLTIAAYEAWDYKYEVSCGSLRLHIGEAGMQRARCTIAIVIAIVAAVAAPALGDRGAVTDPKGDVAGNPPGRKANFDFVKATHGHAPGALKHQVWVAGRMHDPETGHSGLPDLLINVPGHRKPPSCDYVIQPSPPGVFGNKTDHNLWFVLKCSDQQPKKIGPATVTKVGPHRLRFLFKGKEIGSPSRYGWAFIMPVDGDTVYDRVRNKGYALHKLQ